MLSTLRTLAQRVGVPLTASLLSAPFLVGRAAAFWAKEAPAPPPGFMGLSLQNFTPYHCLFGGLLLGVSTAMSMLIRGDVLGISGIVGGVVKGKHHGMPREIAVGTRLAHCHAERARRSPLTCVHCVQSLSAGCFWRASSRARPLSRRYTPRDSARWRPPCGESLSPASWLGQAPLLEMDARQATASAATRGSLRALWPTPWSSWPQALPRQHC